MQGKQLVKFTQICILSPPQKEKSCLSYHIKMLSQLILPPVRLCSSISKDKSKEGKNNLYRFNETLRTKKLRLCK